MLRIFLLMKFKKPNYLSKASETICLSVSTAEPLLKQFVPPFLDLHLLILKIFILNACKFLIK